MDQFLLAASLLAIGFALGYGVRASISRRHRAEAKRRHEAWQSPKEVAEKMEQLSIQPFSHDVQRRSDDDGTGVKEDIISSTSDLSTRNRRP